MIEVRGLEYRYPGSSVGLQIDALTIPAATRTAIVGPSGSGKTTLLRLLAGILPITRGDLTVLGQRLSTMNDRQRRRFRIRSVGQVFQDFRLIDYLDIRQNILLPYHINRALRLTPDSVRRADELADRMELPADRTRSVARLSFGERQRVAICRALITEPQLILADEPTGNLDPQNKQRTLDLLLEYAASQSAMLIMVTHDRGLLPAFERVVDCADWMQRTATVTHVGAEG